MGIRFRKSFKIMPGVKLNLNKSSASSDSVSKTTLSTLNTIEGKKKKA